MTENAIPKVENLAIYYGYPSLINGVNGNLEQATKEFSAYNSIILGADLEQEDHADHQNTIQIIQGVSQETKVFGYVNLAVTEKKIEMDEIKKRVQVWKKMGVYGIFFDSCGFDYGVSRARQNEAFNFVHGEGLVVFVNAFSPEDIFSNDTFPDNQAGGGNAKGEKHCLEKGDLYLHESFQIQNNQCVDSEFWAKKCLSAQALTKGLDIKHMITTTTNLDTPFKQDLLNYAYWSTLLWGFHGFSWGEKWFSASDNSLPFRERPEIEVGLKAVADVIIQGHLYTRQTDAGTILIDGDSHYGSFQKS